MQIGLKSVAYDLNISVNLQTLPGLLEILDYYKPCSELCLARNKRIGSNGIRVIGNFISKVGHIALVNTIKSLNYFFFISHHIFISNPQCS